MTSWLKNVSGGNHAEQEEEGEFQNQSGTITFSDMNPQHMKKVGLTKSTPETMHLTICHGLNLRGICRNQTCKVFEKEVWIKLGYGKFHINQEVYNAKCPICKQEVPQDTVLSVGYTRTILKAEGKLDCQMKKKQWEPPKETEGMFILFEGYNGATAKWNFLTLTAQKP